MVLAQIRLRRGLGVVLTRKETQLPKLLLGESELYLHVLFLDRASAQNLSESLTHDGYFLDRLVVEENPPGLLAEADNTVDFILAIPLLPRGKTTGRGPGLADLPAAGILRGLWPGGVTILGCAQDLRQNFTAGDLPLWTQKSGLRDSSLRQDLTGLWLSFRKPIPGGFDTWNHGEHRPDNNPVSWERGIPAPCRNRWTGGPLYVAMPAVTVAGSLRPWDISPTTCGKKDGLIR